MPHIHPTAVVDPRAELADDVWVGPFCFIDAGAVLGPGCRLESHVTICQHTTIGARNTFAQGSVIGGNPQDRGYKGETTYLRMGDDNVIREYVTIHRAAGEGKATMVGDRNYLMAMVHLGHNVTVMDDVTITNNVGVAGHVTVESRVTIGGMTGVHQFVRIGKLAMVGGMTRVARDVPPFMLCEGLEQTIHDINAVGLRRTGVTQEARSALHKACKLLFKSQIPLNVAIETVRREVPQTPEVEYLLAFQERLYEGKNGRGDQR